MILHMYDFARKEVMVSQETGTGLEFAMVESGVERGSAHEAKHLDVDSSASEREPGDEKTDSVIDIC